MLAGLLALAFFWGIVNREAQDRFYDGSDNRILSLLRGRTAPTRRHPPAPLPPPQQVQQLEEDGTQEEVERD